jgi:hypothetical protein
MLTFRSTSPAWPHVRRALIVAAASILVGCAGGPPHAGNSSPEADTNASRRPIGEVLAEHTPHLMAMPGVVGTAESALPNGQPSVMVLVVKLTPELRRAIPKVLGGYPVVIEESGEIRAMPERSR